MSENNTLAEPVAVTDADDEGMIHWLGLAWDDEPTLCPFCGTSSSRKCDLIKDAGFCAWKEMDDAD